MQPKFLLQQTRHHGVVVVHTSVDMGYAGMEKYASFHRIVSVSGADIVDAFIQLGNLVEFILIRNGKLGKVPVG